MMASMPAPGDRLLLAGSFMTLLRHACPMEGGYTKCVSQAPVTRPRGARDVPCPLKLDPVLGVKLS